MDMDSDSRNTDEGLQGNEKIEQAVYALQQKPSEEGLAHVLTVVRRRMREGGQFILAVEPPKGDGKIEIQAVQTADSRQWWAAFTSFEEELKGSGNVMSTFLSDMEKLFTTAVRTEEISGVMINPWNRTLMLDKNLIQIVLGKPETYLPELHTVDDIYEWIDKNIEYGWLDRDGKAHICEMKDFRRQYRTMSVSQTIQQKIGTCIEQVALMHELLNAIEVPNQMYCCRIYEPDDYGNLEEEEHMHCFLLYFQNGKTYHMEHPNVEQKGIYEYPTEEDALRTITEYYVKLRGGKESPTTCFSGVPAGVSFREFNAFINHLA